MKRLSAGIALAAFALSVAWLAATRWAGPIVAPEQVATGIEPERSDSPGEAEARERGEGVEGGEAPVAEGRRVESPADPEPAAAAGLEVRVVDATTSAPVAGAEVRWWHAPEGVGRWQAERMFERAFGESALEESPGELGEVVLTDANGRATIEGAAGIGCALASTGEAFGRAHGSAAAGAPLTVRLYRDFDLRARVVDTAGRPVKGATVAFRVRWGDWFVDYATARTDAEGRAHVRHAGAALDGDGIERGDWCSVALAELVEPPVEARFEFDAPPSEVVELIAPHAGACELSVVDERGQLVTEPLDLSLALLPDSSEPFDEDREPLVLYREHVEGGRARFAFVTLGRELVATAARAGGEVEHEARGPGPALPGELARLTVRLGESAPSVAARVVDEPGRPLAGVELVVRIAIEGERASERPARVVTDEAGRFVLDLRPERDAAERRALVLTLQDEAGVERARARHPLPQGLVAGRRELGDIALAPSPLLARGRVVDALGEAVAGARVQLWIRVYWSNDRTRVSWSSSFQPWALTDRAGRFELRGAVEEATFRIDATHERVESEPLIVPVGAEDVVLTIPAVGQFAGRVLLDPSAAPDDVSVGGALVGATDETVNGYGGTKVAADGSFLLRGLHPGEWSFEVAVNGDVVATMEGILVEAAATARDPRLDPLDLRGRQRVIRLRVVDEHGEPILYGGQVVHERLPDGREQSTGSSFQNGAVALTAGREPVSVTLSANGYLTKRLDGVVEDATVTLRRGPLLRFVLAGIELPEPPYALEVRLEPTGESAVTWMDASEAQVGADGEVLFRPTFTGSAEVELWLLRHRDGGSGGTRIEGGHEARIEIADEPGEQRVELELTPAALAKARQSLER